MPSEKLHVSYKYKDLESMKSPVRVAVTGAAGQISYSLIFRIAAGEMLGPDQPVILQLLEITPALEALKGTVMEIEDCAFPLVQGITQSDDPKVAFQDADYCLLVGARPAALAWNEKIYWKLMHKYFLFKEPLLERLPVKM